jgi:hypothetical protein
MLKTFPTCSTLFVYVYYNYWIFTFWGSRWNIHMLFRYDAQSCILQIVFDRCCCCCYYPYILLGLFVCYLCHVYQSYRFTLWWISNILGVCCMWWYECILGVPIVKIVFVLTHRCVLMQRLFRSCAGNVAQPSATFSHCISCVCWL